MSFLPSSRGVINTLSGVSAEDGKSKLLIMVTVVSRGHTKNVCDRMFNLLKIRYRKADVFSMSQLVDVLNASDTITFNHVGPAVFFEYCEMLDCFYKNFASGTVQKNHIFVVNYLMPTTMLSKPFDNEEPSVAYNHLIHNANRISRMKQYQLKQLQAPGMRDIKAVELWKKWGPFVPEEFREDICPKPADAVINRVKGEKSKKAKAALQAKKKRAASSVPL